MTGGASGDLSSTVTLTASTGFNDFYQGFIPGAALSFHLVLNSQAGENTPDTFAFSILTLDDDNYWVPIPTTDPIGADSLLSVEMTAPPSPTDPAPPLVVKTFGSDPDYTNLDLAPPVATSVVPEPSSVVTALVGLALISGWRLGRRRRAA